MGCQAGLGLVGSSKGGGRLDQAWWQAVKGWQAGLGPVGSANRVAGWTRPGGEW